MEAYMTFHYAIKYWDVWLLCHALREICIIMQTLTALKPKYAWALLRQLLIFNTKTADDKYSLENVFSKCFNKLLGTTSNLLQDRSIVQASEWRVQTFWVRQKLVFARNW